MEEQPESSSPQSPPIRTPRLQSIPSGGLESVMSIQPCHDSGDGQSPSEGAGKFITIEDSKCGRRLIIPWQAAQSYRTATDAIKWESLGRDKPVSPRCYDLVGSDGNVISGQFWKDLIKPGVLLQLRWTCDCGNHPGPENNYDEGCHEVCRRRRPRSLSPSSDYSDAPRQQGRARSRSIDSLHHLMENERSCFPNYRYDDCPPRPAMSPDLTQDLDQLRRRVSNSGQTAPPTSRFHIAYATMPRRDGPRQIVVGPEEQVEREFPLLNMKWVHMQRESMDFDEFQVAAINEFGKDPKSSHAILSLLRQVQIKGLWNYGSRGPVENSGCALDNRKVPETRFIAFPYLREAHKPHANPAEGGPRCLLDAFSRPWPSESLEESVLVHQVWILLHGAGILTCGSMDYENLLGNGMAIVPIEKFVVLDERMIYLNCLPTFNPEFRGVCAKECRSFFKLNALAQDMVGPPMDQNYKLLFLDGSEVTATSWAKALSEGDSAPIVILVEETSPRRGRRRLGSRSVSRSTSPARVTATRLVLWSNRPARQLSLSPPRSRRRYITARDRELGSLGTLMNSISLDEDDTKSEQGDKSDAHQSPAAGTELDYNLVPFFQWSLHCPSVDGSFDHSIQSALDSVLSSVSSDSQVIASLEYLLEQGNQCIAVYAPLSMHSETPGVRTPHHHLPVQAIADKQEPPWTASRTFPSIVETPDGDEITERQRMPTHMANLALELLAYFVPANLSHPLLLKYYGAIDSWAHLATETIDYFSSTPALGRYLELLNFSLRSIALLYKRVRDIAVGACTEFGPDEGCSNRNAEIQQAFLDAFRKIILFIFACRTALHEIHSNTCSDDPFPDMQRISQHQHILRVLARDARAQIEDARECVLQAFADTARKLYAHEPTARAFSGQPMSSLELVDGFVQQLTQKPTRDSKDEIDSITPYHHKLKLAVSSNPSRRHLPAITAHRNTIQALRLLTHFQQRTGSYLMSAYISNDDGGASRETLRNSRKGNFHIARHHVRFVRHLPGGAPKQVALKRLLDETKAMRTEILDFAQSREPPVDIPPSNARLFGLEAHFGTALHLIWVTWAVIITATLLGLVFGSHT